MQPDAHFSKSDIARTALAFEPTPLTRSRARQFARTLTAEADEIRRSGIRRASKEALLNALNARFFSDAGYGVNRDSTSPDNSSTAAVLENRRGSCVGLAIVYLALAHRLGLDAHAVATPVHLFVRVRADGRLRNVELLESGQALDDGIYRRRYKIDDASVASGVFMADLTNSEVIAHLLSNQAVAFNRQGKLDDAMARYAAALQLHPKLAVAWYNRGIDLMNAGLLKEALDSFNRAIELYPSDAQAHNNRGLAKMKLGDADGARADFEVARQLEAGLGEAAEDREGLPQEP